MAGGRLLVRGGRVVDTSTGRDGPADVLLEDGLVARVGEGLEAEDGAEVLDAKGLVVCPGFVDIHVHLREPGHEYKETIATGSAAALAGGFTAVCAMPNTRPVVDEPSVVEFVKKRAREAGGARVYPIGAVSRGLQGEELAEMGEMRKAGAVAFTDDGKPVWNTALMRRALEYAAMLGVPVAQHAEDRFLHEGASMNEGYVSTCLGLPGSHWVGEAATVARDLLLVEMTGGRYHVLHISAARTLQLVREAKERGLPVTCEAAPHHLLLCDKVCREFDANAKMNPPLRAEEDREALVEALVDGTVDCVASDHAPHAPVEKEVEFTAAPFGVVGLETTVPLLLDRLVGPGRLLLARLVEVLSTAPCRVYGLPGGSLEEGAPGDLTLLDLEREVVVDPARFRSRSRNTPFAGWRLRGAPAATVVEGEVRWRAEGE